VAHVRAAGVALETLSIHRAMAEALAGPGRPARRRNDLRRLATSVGRLLGAHLEALARSPRRYLTTLALALRTGAGGAQERLPSFAESRAGWAQRLRRT
jgi:hypothetical protein